MSLNHCNRVQGTIKQRAFVRHLFDITNPLTFGNGTQAARKARYRGSDGVLANIAWENVRKPQVIKMAESLVESILSTEGVEKEITTIATTPTEVDGAMRMKALDLLTKIKGMVTQKVETTDTTDRDTKSHWAAILADLAAENNMSPLEAERQMQNRLSDASRAAYDEAQDPTKHPECWPSGCLVAVPAASSNPINEIDGEQ